MKRKGVAILGSTGSVGRSALEVCEEAAEHLEVVALAAHRSVDALAAQVARFRPLHVAVVDDEAARRLVSAVADLDWSGTIHAGIDGLLELVGACGAEAFLVGISGAACLPVSLEIARRPGAVLGLANKESVVMAGPILMDEVRRHGSTLVPVDSEHSALFQSLLGHRGEDVRRLHLTSSGGPFRTTPKERFPTLTRAEALDHPKWKMGEKITIDSATMMNKALEIVEARWLFDTPAEHISVVVHPQAIVHSMVEYVDGSLIAQLGLPDMKVPIRYALGYPGRLEAEAPGVSFPDFSQLTFEPPDTERFPSLLLGFRAAREGGTMGAVLNAANEEAVDLFLAERIRFDQITTLVAQVMDAHEVHRAPSVEDVLESDRWARRTLHELPLS